ncbi:hypothetical protein Ocin01_03420 [Orchesella cincta]|uniref:Pleiotrophin/Midkine C-terminal domain-containing protein n=1 Tax=Orchesella cincta TaxID=48709 RepID=A0A1D2NDC6_ORCCI|nr:hypothetical protein Ocin01_03420 [Orchesella cincta]
MKQILLFISAILVLLCIQANSKPLSQDSTAADNEYENGLDLLRRITRQAAPAKVNNGKCKYKKGAWSACDPQTKVRTRTFTLKKGDVNQCEGQKTIRKDCKGKNKDKEGKRNKSRDGNGNNQQPKNNRERDRPRKKNKHADANNNNNN